jgi:hypothetical protein
MQTESGDDAARFEVAADDTYTAHAIPAPIACGAEVYSGSPPGCADGRDAVDFSGKWKLSDDEPRELRLYFRGFPRAQGVPRRRRTRLLRPNPRGASPRLRLRPSIIVIGRRTAAAGLSSALILSLTGCSLPTQPHLAEPVGSWHLQTENGGSPARLTIAADHTYTAHDLPPALACRLRIAAGSPPGCRDGSSSVSFSGKWRLADGNPRELWLEYDDFLVRRAVRYGDGLGFSVRSVENPRPDYVFLRTSSSSGPLTDRPEP